MKRFITVALWTVGLLGISQDLARAQGLTYTYRTSANPGILTVIAPNSQIQFPPALLGANSSITLLITNGTKEDVIINRAEVSGNAAFAVQLVSITQLGPGDTAPVTVVYKPTQPNSVNATLTLQFNAKTLIPNATFALSANGLQADLVVTYVVNPNGNQTILKAGDAIVFGNAPVGQTSTVTLAIQNKGNAPGTLKNIDVTGAGFSLSGLPLLPSDIEAGKTVSVTVTFSPTAAGSVSASLTLDLGATTINARLSAQGISARLIYETLIDGNFRQVTPDEVFVLPSIAVATTLYAPFRIRNVGDSATKISTIAIFSPVYKLTDVPVLPVTIAPGGVLTFTVTFTARDIGAATARLQVDDVVFTLSSSGIGAAISFTAIVGSASATIPSNAVVVFPNTGVGGKSTAVIRIDNNGNQAGTITSIALTGGSYSLSSIPELPLNLAPKATASVTVAFTPQALGSATGILQADEFIINLRGTGAAPPDLPAVSITGVSDTASSLAQPTVGLSLAEPYPLDITGKLSLTFTSESFADDSSIQFASGGRSVDFRIPANTKEAIFTQGAPRMAFQTGTVAGTIVLQASFAYAQVNVTPASPPTKMIKISGQPPQLRSVQVGGRSANSLQLIVSGFASTRSVRQLSFDFVASPGSSLRGSSLSADVESTFSAWYQSAASQAFGSQFAAVVTISVTGDASALGSVSVKASNALGSSNVVTLSLQ